MYGTGYTIYNLLLGFVILTLGNGLLYAVHVYEKYGVDSKRRTVTNMLMSQICAAFMIQNLTAMPMLIYYITYPPLGMLYNLTLDFKKDLKLRILFRTRRWSHAPVPPEGNHKFCGFNSR